jgi:hypothetical protein
VRLEGDPLPPSPNDPPALDPKTNKPLPPPPNRILTEGVQFGRLLVGKKDSRSFIIANPGLLPVKWRLAGAQEWCCHWAVSLHLAHAAACVLLVLRRLDTASRCLLAAASCPCPLRVGLDGLPSEFEILPTSGEIPARSEAKVTVEMTAKEKKPDVSAHAAWCNDQWLDALYECQLVCVCVCVCVCVRERSLF